jgi:DNA-binding NarL/FixJ family response regulator
MIRVLLADDHPLVRAGLRTTLASEEDITVVGEATNGYETKRLCEERQPDVVVLDLNMPGPRPVETVTYLREHWPGIRVLVLTAYDEDAYVKGLVGAGVDGYILKDDAPESVVQAVRALVQGGTWFSRSVVGKLVSQTSTAQSHSSATILTEHEQQLLSLIARGWDTARIADELSLSEQTVRNYASRLYKKIGVRSRAEAIIWARERGLDGP